MDSPFASLFLAIQARIKDQCPDIRYIDQDVGQLDYYETRPPISWPAVLLDFGSFDFKDIGEHVQMGNGRVTLRLAFSPFSSANSLVPDITKEKALLFYEIEYRLHMALHAWEATDFSGNMVRRSAKTEMRDDPFRVRELQYELNFEDYSTQFGRNKHLARPKITPVFSDMVAPGREFNDDFNNDFTI